jgi:hydrogenase-1 operon protein HyaE
MTTETPTTVGARAALHPLLDRLVELTAAAVPTAADFDAWANNPGPALLVFTEDPARYRETLDLAVIVPELDKALPGRFRTAVLLPEAARALAPRYGFRRWPALVLLKDGRHVGAIDGLRNWQDYVDELARLLDAEPTRPPTIGIAVTTEAGAAGPTCH